jgi:transcriptional regulator with XRE-family HTH domain
MNTRKSTTIEEFLGRLELDDEFRRQERKVQPFYRLAAEIINNRTRLGITQKVLAKLAKTHQSRISKIESGEHDIRLSTLITIAEAVQCELVISLVPTSQEVYSKADEPYLRLFETGAKLHSDAPSSAYIIVGPQYQDGPVTEGTYGQCE